MRTIINHLVAGLAGMSIIMPADALTLELKPEVSAMGSYVTLNEVAEISDLDNPRLLEVQRLRVALAPKPGQNIRLTRDHIARSLRYESPVLAGQINWKGANAILVSTSSQSIYLEGIRHVAKEKLRAYLSNKVFAPDIQVVESISAPMLPPGHMTITAKSVKPDAPARRMLVEIEITVESHYRRTVPVWFVVKAKIDALVAKSKIGSGTLIDGSMFEIKRIELGLTPRPMIVGMAPDEQLRTCHDVEGGNVLSQDDVERAPPIIRQQQVAIQLLSNGITLETTGIALSDAEIGMPIRVKNPRSGEVFSALVSAPGVATITVR